MFRNFITIVFIAMLFVCNCANAQLVKYNFDNLEQAENFESSSGNWTIISNSENLFLIQGGEYLLNRKSTVSPYAIISGMRMSYNSYKLVTSLNLLKTNDNNGSIGLLFALQDDKRGGYLLEVNYTSQYRIRKLAGSEYVYITGNEKNNGWEKNAVVHPGGASNIIEMRCGDNNYDLYINSHLVKTITNKSYTIGNFGFVIGPGSKGSIDFVHIYTRNDESPLVNPKGNEDATTLVQSINTLNAEVNKLKEENELLRKTIDAVKSETKVFDAEKQKLKDELVMQRSDYNFLLQTNDSLIKVNKALQLELNSIKQDNKSGTQQNTPQKKTDDFNLPK